MLGPQEQKEEQIYACFALLPLLFNKVSLFFLLLVYRAAPPFEITAEKEKQAKQLIVQDAHHDALDLEGFEELIVDWSTKF